MTATTAVPGNTLEQIIASVTQTASPGSLLHMMATSQFTVQISTAVDRDLFYPAVYAPHVAYMLNIMSTREVIAVTVLEIEVLDKVKRTVGRVKFGIETKKGNTTVTAEPSNS